MFHRSGYSQFEMGSSSRQPHLSSSGLLPPIFGQIASSPSLGATLLAPNITNLVTVRLGSPEEYLTWHTQFTSLLVSHGLLCFVDGSFPPPASMLTSASGESLPNSDFQNWLRINQSIRSWIFATLSSEILIDVRDCPTSFHL